MNCRHRGLVDLPEHCPGDGVKYRRGVSRALDIRVPGGPYALAVGPDGAMWVTLVHSGEIARIGPDGGLDVFPVHPQSKPSIIVAAPDGALWFTRNGDDRIGRIAVDGAQREIELPDGSAPFGLCVGPDDALWFTTMTSGTVGRIGAGDEVDVVAVPGGSPSMITAGPDGAMWFTLNQSSAIGRLDMAGTVSQRRHRQSLRSRRTLCAAHAQRSATVHAVGAHPHDRRDRAPCRAHGHPGELTDGTTGR